MLVPAFLFFIIFSILIYKYSISKKSTLIQSKQDSILLKENFRFFNKSSAINKDGRKISVWRYSSSTWCPKNNSLLRKIIKYNSTSYVYISFTGDINDAKEVDLSSLGPGDYEDPRIIFVGPYVFVVLVKAYNNNANICVALLDSESKDTVVKPIAVRSYDCESRHKNWIPLKINDNKVRLYASLHPLVVYDVNITELINQKISHVNANSIENVAWRGSSTFLKRNDGTNITLLHKRQEGTWNTYEYKFCILDKNYKPKYGPIFKLNNEGGFVYVSGMTMKDDLSYTLNCGINDCYYCDYNVDLNEDLEPTKIELVWD